MNSRISEKKEENCKVKYSPYDKNPVIFIIQYSELKLINMALVYWTQNICIFKLLKLSSWFSQYGAILFSVISCFPLLYRIPYNQRGYWLWGISRPIVARYYLVQLAKSKMYSRDFRDFIFYFILLWFHLSCFRLVLIYSFFNREQLIAGVVLGEVFLFIAISSQHWN